MSATYEPGTVAVATVRGVPNVRVFRCVISTEPRWMAETRLRGSAVIVDEDVTDVRPLVVLDIDDIDAAVPLLRRTVENLRHSVPGYTVLADIADQIEAQTRPPKPPEPTGLGAVVEDAEGTDWHRTREGRWIAADGLRTQAGGWGHIDAVRVLSDGVPA